MKLLGKIIISGTLTTKTGLHIGGSKSSLSIGNIDNNVIKTALDKPYIPGSSIKGKLRSLLARVEGSLFFSEKDKKREKKHIERQIKKGKNVAKWEAYRDNVVASAPTDEYSGNGYLTELFGYSGDSKNRLGVGHTRLLVRDAFLKNENDEIFKKGLTDSKWENVIDRITGTAENPRQQERVPVGAEFGLELVYSVYDDLESEDDANKFAKHMNALHLALELLERDGIGGSISRGYGQVKVEVDSATYFEIDRTNFSFLKAIPLGQQSLLDKFTNRFNNNQIDNGSDTLKLA